MVGHFYQSPYNNIFYSYRAPFRRKDWQDSRVEGQIENNVTRALLDVLYHCSLHNDGQLVKAFIKQMINLKSDAPYDFELLKSNNGIHSIYKGRLQLVKTRKRLLLIRPTDEPELLESTFRKVGTEKRRSIPDGWIFGSNLVVAIESKINEPVRPGQLKRHIKYNLEEQNCDNFNLIRQTTWIDVYEFFDGQKKNLTDENIKFLVEQFCQYLELCGLGGFAGFTDGDFGFFAMTKQQQNDNTDLRFALIAKMWTLAGVVHEKVKDNYKAYRDPGKDLKRQRSRYEYAQAYFICEDLPSDINDIQDEKDYLKKETEFIEDRMKKQAYACIQLYKDGLSVWACITNESNKGNHSAMKNLLKLIEKDAGGLLVKLKEAPNDYAVEFYEEHKEHGKWKHTSLLPDKPSDDLIPVSDITELYFDKLTESIRKHQNNKNVSFTLTKYFNKEELLVKMKNSEDQIKSITEAMKTLYPFIRFLNTSK